MCYHGRHTKSLTSPVSMVTGPTTQAYVTVEPIQPLALVCHTSTITPSTGDTDELAHIPAIPRHHYVSVLYLGHRRIGGGAGVRRPLSGPLCRLFNIGLFNT